MINIQKMNYHHDRAKLLARAMKKAEKSTDRKAEVDLDGKGKPLTMSHGELRAQYDREMSACSAAGHPWMEQQQPG